jgi:hypothetical protein
MEFIPWFHALKVPLEVSSTRDSAAVALGGVNSVTKVRVKRQARAARRERFIILTLLPINRIEF